MQEAESLYTVILTRLPSDQAALRGDAFFGKALAAHRRFLSLGDAGSRTLADSVVGAYASAGRLNSELAVAANNNTALLLRALGLHREAQQVFDAAAAASAPHRRAPFLVNSGRELESMDDLQGAARLYSQALRVDSTFTDALSGLLRVLAASGSTQNVLAAANRWRQSEHHAEAILDALAELLTRESSVSTSEATTALVYLASVLPPARIGPPSFDALARERLGRAVALRPHLSDGAGSLLHAYQRRRDGEPYREPTTAGWWRTAPENGPAVWSSVLRSIGEWYDQQGTKVLARSFYENALGMGRASLQEAWIDRRAIMPLALIYASTDPQRGQQLQSEVDRFSEIIFSAKGAAYSKGDVEQVRDFHMALGAIYAARGQWAGSGARSAEFQIEAMRRATQELNRRDGVKVVDPPELIEKLALRYETTNRPSEAASLKSQLKDDYVRKGKPSLGDSAVRRIDMRRTRPPPGVDAKLTTRSPDAVAKAGAEVVTPQAATARPNPVVVANAAVAPATAAIELQLRNARTHDALVSVAVAIVMDGQEQQLQTDATGVVRLRVAAGVQEANLRINVKGYAVFSGNVKVAPLVRVELTPRR